MAKQRAQTITIRGARQHNLRGVDLDIPKGRLTVISGVSGSGKSSLAFDTLYAEGQRAYVESLSTYARQFLEQLERPDVDQIDGIQPAIAIRQHNPVRSSRSTVGTATEVYDYLRILFARLGEVRCRECGNPVRPDAPDSASREVMDRFAEGARVVILFPVETTETLPFEDLARRLVAQGYLRAMHDGAVLSLEERWPVTPGAGVRVEVVADRLKVGESFRLRMGEAIEAALHAGEGEAAVLGLDDGLRIDFSDRYQCGVDGRTWEAPTPQLFSFNNPQGACPACNGFGQRLEFDERRIVPDLDRTLAAGAIRVWSSDSWRAEQKTLREFCERKRIPLDAPFRKLTAAQRRMLMENREDESYTGVIPWLEHMRENPSRESHRFFVRRYLGRVQCRECGGSRLREEARAVLLGGEDIASWCGRGLPGLQELLDGLDLDADQRSRAGDVLEELRARVRFLRGIGLDYLSLDRASRTLSGGEMQRIHLANALGGRLVETL